MSVAPRDRVRSPSSAGVLDAVGLAVVLAPLAIGAVHIEARLTLAAVAALVQPPSSPPHLAAALAAAVLATLALAAATIAAARHPRLPP